MKKSELMTVAETARFLLVSETTVLRLLEAGKLKGYRVGKQWRFRHDELLADIRAEAERHLGKGQA